MEDVLEIPVQQEQFQQEPDPPKKKLWKNLSDKHLYTKSYEDFEKQFSTPESIDKLYSVVSSKQLYTKSNEDFKSQFFPQPAVKKKSALVDFAGSSLEAGNAQSIGGDGSEIPTKEYYTTSTGEMVETDPISLSQKYNELKNSTKEIEGLGDRGTMRVVADEEKVKAAKKLREDFKDTDLEGIYSETKDLPEGVLRQFQGELLQDRETNPQLYQRKLSNLKWRSEFEKKILSDVDNGNISADEYNQIKHTIEMLPIVTGEGNYTNQRPAIQSLAKDIQLYGGGNKDKLLKDFAVEVSKVYGNPDSKAAETFKSTPESKYLTPEAQLGYQYIQDVSPEKSEQYKRLFIDTKNLSPDEQRGYNHLMLTLEETGIGVQQNAVNEELNNLSNIAEKNGGLTEEQISKAEKLEKQLNELQIKSDELDSKYPERLRDKVSDAVNEIMGKDIGWGSYAMVKTGQAFKNTAQGIWEAVSSPFMSDESNSLRELAIMGEHIESESNLRQPDKNKGLQYDKLIIQPELQEQVDKIKNDSLLSDEEKRNKLFSLFYSNKDKFGRIPIVNGRFNINPSSILYGITDLGASLVPFVVIEAATGGIGGTGSAAKFLRTFNAAAATTFHDEYAGALLEGKSQSEAYKSAMATTAINSFAMAGAATPTELKAIAKGNSSAEKIIQNMSDDAIQKVLDRGTPKGLKAIASNVKDRAKKLPSNVLEGVKTGAKFEAYMAGANTLNDREVDFKQMLLGVANFGILGAGLAQIGHKSPTEFQKSAGLKFGEKPDDFIVIAEQMKKDGQLNEAEFEHRKSLIEQYSEAYKTLPKANSNGKPLDENQKAEYLYNAVIKNEGNKGKSTLPPKQAEKAEKTALVADHKNDLILDPKTDKQLESRKSLLKKQLEKKDENGKPELSDKERKDYEAELEAVNDAIENKPEVKEQPLEGKGEVSTVKTKEEGELKVSDEKYKDIPSQKLEYKDGVAFVHKDSEGGKDHLFISRVDVANKSKGTGSEFLKKIEDYAKEKELDEVYTIPETEASKRFFEKNGYVDNDGVLIKKLDKPTQSKATVKEGEVKPTTNEETKTEVPKSTEKEVITETEPDKKVQGAAESGEIKGITQAANEVRRQEIGLPEFEKNPESFEKWNNEAERLLKNGYDVEGLMNKIDKENHYPTPVENAIRKIYYATIDAEIAKNPTDKLLTLQKRNAEVGDLANRRLGQSLVSLKGEGNPLNSISDFYLAKIEAAGVEKLTDEQKAEVKKQYEAVQKTNEEATLKIQKLEEENAKLRAEVAIKKTKAATQKEKKDFVKEREDIKKSILDKWNKSKNVGIVADPSKDLLMEITPDVAKLVKSYIQEGVVKLEEIVSKIHEELKGYIPAITEKNINDIISGQYDKPRETKGDLLAKLRSIKDRKSEEAVKILAKIKSGDFDPPQKVISWVDNPEIKKNFPKEYNEALDAIKAKEDARHEFDIALLRDQMARRSLGEKATDALSKAAGTVKAITTGIDDSAVAIQTYVSMLVRPRTGAQALYQHIRQGFSQKKFDRWLSALHNSPYFKEMREMGLDVTEPSSLKEREKEEIFNNRFSGTVKIKGEEYKLLDAPLKPFERAFTTLGNVTRVVGYRTISEKYKREGYTPEKDPELFKSLARRLNTETGRGAVNEYVDMANKVVTMGIWSPKLMAQKFNILGVSDLASIVLSKAGTKGYYRQLHPKERMAAIVDVAQFATTVVSLSYGFALAFGGDIDTDPLSSTFMDVRLPNGKSYNFTGGFSGYIRAIFQFVMGEKHRGSESKKVGRLETAGRFFRGKTPPVTSASLNLASGKDFMGKPTSPVNETIKLAPISLRGIYSQLEKDGVMSLFTQGIPTFFGFNVKDERDYQKEKPKKPTKKVKKPKKKQ